MSKEFHCSTLPIVDVYVGKIPAELGFSSVYPEERAREIENCRCERVKKEKYCAWHLLEYAFKKTFGSALNELYLQKNENGKWISKNFHFSISHTDGIVAVAVSNSNVGVDIEKRSEKLLNVAARILTERETSEYRSVSQENKIAFLADKWTQKESVFKSLNEKAFKPGKIEVAEYSVVTKVLEYGGEHYHISVTTDTPKSIRLFEVANYLEEGETE